MSAPQRAPIRLKQSRRTLHLRLTKKLCDTSMSPITILYVAGLSGPHSLQTRGKIFDVPYSAMRNDHRPINNELPLDLVGSQKRHHSASRNRFLHKNVRSLRIVDIQCWIASVANLLRQRGVDPCAVVRRASSRSPASRLQQRSIKRVNHPAGLKMSSI